MINSTDNIYSLALSIASSPKVNHIMDYISTYSPHEIYNKISKKIKLKTQAFISTKYPGTPIESAKLIYETCNSKSIKIIDFWDNNYPHLLKEINTPPLVLYCKGNLESKKVIAIVGTRKTDKKSSQIARRLSFELSHAGFTIVSGMAMGIDREAHIGALQGSNPTIGVLANGIDIIYPRYNKDIYNAIISSQNSSLISEYPPEIYSGRWTFVRRNRLISGISIGTVIIKAGEKSGALITGRYALEQNREVFVCPGNTFDKEFTGCHKLIKDGAVLVADTDDILRELCIYNKTTDFNKNILLNNNTNKFDNQNLISPENNKLETKFKNNSIELKIIEILTNGDKDIDNLLGLLNCTASQINESIILLELSGIISKNGNIISRL